jgi:hypothetical protein
MRLSCSLPRHPCPLSFRSQDKAFELHEGGFIHCNFCPWFQCDSIGIDIIQSLNYLLRIAAGWRNIYCFTLVLWSPLYVSFWRFHVFLLQARDQIRIIMRWIGREAVYSLSLRLLGQAVVILIQPLQIRL